MKLNNITTIEDPVEIRIDGLSQIEIDAINLFTKWEGPALAAFNRRTTSSFKGKLSKWAD